MQSTLIKQVRVLDPASNTDKIADVLIDGDKIQAIENNLTNVSENTTVIADKGLILAPGLVDLYSYSSDPGYEERETISSLIAAATAGGFTRLAILPDMFPVLDNPTLLAWLEREQKKVKRENCAHLDFWGALTLGIQGKQMTELADLQEGIIGFTDGYPIENLALLRRLLDYVQPLKKTIALVNYNRDLKSSGVMREGKQSLSFGLPGNPEVAETTAIASVLELIDGSGVSVHLMRVSTCRGVELIANAKARGVPITASTTWMHLLFNTEDLCTYDPNLRLEPPLGNKRDMMALIDGVKQGIIDAIAIDHRAYTYEEKTVAFAEAPPGVIGLELALPILWQRFVASGEWSALELWQALSLRPQLCLQKEPLRCFPGHQAELILFAPEKTWAATKDNLKSLSQNTPWFNQTIIGRVIRMWNSCN